MPFYHNKSPVDTNNSLLTIIHVILTRDMFSHLLAVMKKIKKKSQPISLTTQKYSHILLRYT